MLERALTNIRTALVLRDCAAHAGSAAERRVLIAFARIHEARASTLIGAHRGEVPRPADPEAAGRRGRSRPRASAWTDRLAAWVRGGSR